MSLRTNRFPSTTEVPSCLMGTRVAMFVQPQVMSGTGGDTIANTTTRTVFGSQPEIKAGFSQERMVYTLQGYGTYRTPAISVGTTTCGVQLYNTVTGAIVEVVTTPAIPNGINAVDLPFHFEASMLVQSIGKNGVFRCGGKMLFNTTLLGGQPPIVLPVTLATVDTTAKHLVQCWVKFSVQSPTISATLPILFGEYIKAPN